MKFFNTITPLLFSLLAYYATSSTIVAQVLTNSSTNVIGVGHNYDLPTGVIWVDQSATTTLRDIAYPIALSYVQNISGIPDQSLSSNGADVTVSDIQVSNFQLPKENFNIVFKSPDQIAVTADKISVTVTGNYNAKASFISGSGGINIQIADTSVYVVVTVDTDGKGRPIVNVLTSGATINTLNIQLTGSNSGLFSAFIPAAQQSLKNTLQQTLAQQLQTVANQTLTPLLQNVPLTYQFPLINQNAQVYYGVVDEVDPQHNHTAFNMTNTFATIVSAAEVQPVADYPAPPSSVEHHPLPSTVRPTNGTTYPQIAVSIDEYLINSALYTAAATNMSYTVTNSSLPQQYQSYLQTGTLAFIYPTLSDTYPNRPLIAQVQPSYQRVGQTYAYPTVTFNHTGNHTFYAPLLVNLSVVNQQEQVVPLATILVILNGTLQADIKQNANGTYSVVGNATAIGIKIITISQSYNFQPPLDQFTSVANQLGGGALLGTLNSFIRQGYLLPQTPYVKPVGATLKFADHVATLLTNYTAA